MAARDDCPLESKIQASIMRALEARGALVMNTLGGTVAVGTPDIIGVLPGGRAFAIEVKRPGRTGELRGGLTMKQAAECWRWAELGAVVGAGVDSVEEALKLCFGED